MGKYDETRADGLGKFRHTFLDTHPNVTEIEVVDGEQSPMIVVTYKGWTAVINPMGIGGRYLDVDVHAFSGDAAHKARVIGFTHGGCEHLGNGQHTYPLTAVIVGEDQDEAGDDVARRNGKGA